MLEVRIQKTKHLFAQGVTDLWNSLLQEVLMAPGLDVLGQIDGGKISPSLQTMLTVCNFQRMFPGFTTDACWDLLLQNGG